VPAPALSRPPRLITVREFVAGRLEGALDAIDRAGESAPARLPLPVRSISIASFIRGVALELLLGRGDYRPVAQPLAIPGPAKEISGNPRIEKVLRISGLLHSNSQNTLPWVVAWLIIKPLIESPSKSY
jgi:hypothetical protein